VIFTGPSEVLLREVSPHAAVTAPAPPLPVTAPAPPLAITAPAPRRKSTEPMILGIQDAVPPAPLMPTDVDDAPTLVPPRLSFKRPGGAAPRPARRRRGPLT